MDKLTMYAGDEAARAYRYHRQQSDWIKGAPAGDIRPNVYGYSASRSAAKSLELARVDLIAGTLRYPAELGSGFGGTFGEGLRWVERPGFVCFADELVGRGIEHTGWYTDTDGDNALLRGAVYQLPSRDGRSQYVPAYRAGFYSHGHRQWQDENSDSAVFAFGDICQGETGGEEYRDPDHYGAFRDAAIRADRIAEIAAESDRQYNDAWQVARQWEDLAETAADERQAVRQLIRDMRQARGADVAPSICSALRAAVRRHLDAYAAALTERAEIAESFGFWVDGRQQSVSEFAAVNL